MEPSVKTEPRQKLVTFIGDYLDRTSYKVIAFIIAGIILSSAFLFWVLGAAKLASQADPVCFLDALYFSVITFTSLGYGDIAPIGAGKIIAALEVLSGLVFIAVLVGKLASERQAALLLLVYTSEQQHRLSAFSKGIQAYDIKLNKDANNYEHEKLNKHSKALYKYITGLQLYLEFQSNEGRLASFGNTSTLTKLYKRFLSLYITTLDILFTAGIEPKTYRKLERILNRMSRISSGMKKFHSADEHATALFNELENQRLRLVKWNNLRAQNKEASMFFDRPNPTKRLVKKVEALNPIFPWDRDLDKFIASELRIPRRLAGRCLDIIRKKNNYQYPE
ncbi:potassium channel family protein [Hymenobacter pini]|uniref:potassium channel family protein n=1 Tax=Hymenobacter pini TaxID=2880879 RepID=UPI001CF19875|nr:potassium channel family protein [Hymenobacter pini]MCA8830504.1 potassium channel family protein [Hymenobacter pini]